MLVIIEDRPWGSDPSQPAQLREKINTYAGYVIDGSLSRDYPETVERPVRVQITCADQPCGDIAAIIEHARTKLGELGIQLIVQARS
jgi:hypothetical protein